MSSGGDTHVFVSYVHEDADDVDKLCAVLEAAQIPYWRDRNDLDPGDAWRAKIRSAIRDGSLVFLACFSENSRAKSESYMNEELTLAVEEFRLRPPGKTWLIPVRFDDGPVPDWDLGAGRSLSDLNYTDLFGAGYAPQAARLVTTIGRLLGEKQLSVAASTAAVDQAVGGDRVEMLRSLTKEMLLEPSRRIQLDDLISQEVQRLLAVLSDESRIRPLQGTYDEQLLQLCRAAEELFDLVAPFCASLHVACRWGEPSAIASWASGLQALVAGGVKPASGGTALTELRNLFGTAGVLTAAITCQVSGSWGNLKALTIDRTVKEQYGGLAVGLLEATDIGAAFRGSPEWVANTLAHSAKTGDTFEQSLSKLKSNELAGYHTPVDDWLHDRLRPLLADQLPDADSYATAWDSGEAMLGFLAQDAATVRHRSLPDRSFYVSSHWLGRGTWRASQYQGNAVQDLSAEFERLQGDWPPLKAGLFGASADRAIVALGEYATTFNHVARNRLF